MENNRTRYGMLSVNYVEDENNYHCVCDCGTRLIVSKQQLNDDSSCGCVYRKMLLSLVGKNDDTMAQETPINEDIDERGIYFDKDKNKWRARITFQAKKYHLGYHADKNAALKIRKEAEKNLGNNFLAWLKSYKSTFDQSE